MQRSQVRQEVESGRRRECVVHRFTSRAVLRVHRDSPPRLATPLKYQMSPHRSRTPCSLKWRSNVAPGIPAVRAHAKIRVLQRRAYGLRDAEYLRLKLRTCMLPQF
jgi:hypothetical protein